MRISDWSSDVCSSDLLRFDAVEGFWIRRPWTSSERCAPALQPAPETADAGAESDVDKAPEVAGPPPPVPVESQTVGIAQFSAPDGRRTLRRGRRPSSAKIGRGSCRERGCTYVEIAVAAVTSKKKQRKPEK